jgi:hypothetical protein
VFQKVLRQPNFTWAEHGEALPRQRKPWYYGREPRPDIAVAPGSASSSAGIPAKSARTESGPGDNDLLWNSAPKTGDVRARRSAIRPLARSTG